MKKDFLILIIGASFIISLGAEASASTPMDKFKKTIEKLGKQKKSPRIIAPQCTNFSGVWEGTCTDDLGNSWTDILRISQDDCTYIIKDGYFLNINGSNSASSVPQPGDKDFTPSNFTIFHGWNDAQSTLKSISTFSSVESESSNFNGMIASILTDEMWMVGDQIRTKGTYYGPIVDLDGPTKAHWAHDECTYQKRDETR